MDTRNTVGTPLSCPLCKFCFDIESKKCFDFSVSRDPRKQLRTKIEKLPGGFAEAADLLGVTREWLYMVCNGAEVNNLKFAGKVRQHFGIPVADWLTKSAA